MEPLNQEERSKALIRFMSFFTVTLVLTVLAFYFNVLTRNASADINREKLKRFIGTETEMNRILKDFNGVNVMIDKISFNPSDATAHEGNYQKVKDKLDEFSSKDSLLRPVCDTLKTCLRRIAALKFEYADRLKDGETMTKKDALITSLQAEKKKLEEDLEDMEDDLNDCKNSK